MGLGQDDGFAIDQTMILVSPNSMLESTLTN